MTKKDLPEELIHKYLQESCSEEELAIVESWHIHDLSKSTYLPSKENIAIVSTRMAHKLTTYVQAGNKTQQTIRLWQRVALTASILLIVSSVAFLYTGNPESTSVSVQRKSTLHDILPGGYKAILTLYNGNKVRLNSKINEGIIREKNVNIRIESGQKIVYQSEESKGTQLLNSLETPRGGQYQLILPDGTKVWLNASSTLTYPTAFTSKERLVKLIGEAFFEVSKDSNRPFKVQSKDQVVEVLGTHFNISAYPEERQTLTTLLEGKIKIRKHNINKTLNPGQGALITEGDNDILITQADIEKNMAWKNNEFIFNGENLRSIMRSIARWYDVDIIYKNYSDDTKYWGTVSRSKNISAVLRMLESTGKIKFHIEGRRIIAMN
ncbi:FecR protein [Pedobacter steynii]|uniref:FecR protein n=1 Tax=Pedobacter steynii TaxID=430522 RepID=A0A1G9RX37_9SPHI|nr:FecR family protein [Pedobacter steynii]NQX37618.1 FecR family protein [Pedobacter steynii]SDM27742.1 FecR protein [Pedobacter steynii]